MPRKTLKALFFKKMFDALRACQKENTCKDYIDTKQVYIFEILIPLYLEPSFTTIDKTFGFFYLGQHDFWSEVRTDNSKLRDGIDDYVKVFDKGNAFASIQQRSIPIRFWGNKSLHLLKNFSAFCNST